MAQLTRDEAMKVLLYEGPATRYKEDVVAIAREEGYRLIDSRNLKGSFVNKMKGIEKIAGKKMMLIEGTDVKLFTKIPKPVKDIPKSSEQRAIESNEAVAKAIQLIAENVGGKSDKSLTESTEKELAELKRELAESKKSKK